MSISPTAYHGPRPRSQQRTHFDKLPVELVLKIARLALDEYEVVEQLHQTEDYCAMAESMAVSFPAIQGDVLRHVGRHYAHYYMLIAGGNHKFGTASPMINYYGPVMEKLGCLREGLRGDRTQLASR